MSSTATVARPHANDAAHWYHVDGKPCYEMPNKSKPGQTRATTLKDARALNLLPSVTTILKVLDKPGLNRWLVEQAVLAVKTSPQLPGESLDAFIDRILNQERVQDQERDIAAKRGVAIHNALEMLCQGQGEFVEPDIAPWVRPAYEAIAAKGAVAATERILVGRGYAGRTDIILECADWWEVLDYKSTKGLPEKGAWPEHRLQLAAYAKAFLDKLPDTCNKRRVRVANMYISTVECGKFAVWETEEWFETYERGFSPLLTYWQFATGHQPAQ